MMAWQPLYADDELGYSGAGGYEKDAATYAFAEPTVRQGFVRKVLCIAAAQIAVAAAVVGVCVLCAPVRAFASAHHWTLWLSLSLTLAIFVTLYTWEKARRQHPLNLVMLAAFTLCGGLLLGTLSAVLGTHVVLVALGISACVVFALSLFAIQTRVDLTASGGALLSLLLALLLAAILQSFIHISWLQLFLSAGGAFLLSTYLALDVQLLVSSPHHAAAALSADEQVCGALCLYLDVVTLLLKGVRLLHDLSRQ